MGPADPRLASPAGTARTDPALTEQVAWACRILATEGYLDLTLGHVSARSPAAPGTMWIKRKGPSLDEVEPGDVVPFEIGGDLGAAGDEMHLEAVLHTEVYKRRPDVGAIVHGHPPYATALGATDAKLEQLTHDAAMFTEGLAAFDGIPELIEKPEQGRAVAEALGDRAVVLLRNHGVLVAERDVRWLVLAAVTLERAIRLQSIAGTLGRPTPIPEELVARIHSRKYRDEFVAEYWDSWIRALRRRSLDAGMEGAG